MFEVWEGEFRMGDGREGEIIDVEGWEAGDINGRG